MQTTLSPEQLNKALRRTPAQKKPLTAKTVPAFSYDPDLLDDVICGMWGRRYDEYEQFPANALRIKSILVLCNICGDFPDFEEVPILIALAKSTRSEFLRQHAISALKQHLADCSGTDSNFKPAAQKLLQTFEKESHEPEPVDTSEPLTAG